MLSEIAPLRAILELNTRLFLNSLDGVSDEVATRRPNRETNHIAFLACHVLDARYYLAGYLGREARNPFKDMFDAARTPVDGLRVNRPTPPSGKAETPPYPRLPRSRWTCSRPPDRRHFSAASL